MVGRRKHNRARNQIFCRRSWKFFLRWRAFRNRDITGRLNEFLELLVCHGGRIHPEAVDENAMDWPRVVRSHRHLGTAAPIHDGAHRKLAAGNPNHARQAIIRGRGRLFVGNSRCPVRFGRRFIRREKLRNA